MRLPGEDRKKETQHRNVMCLFQFKYPFRKNLAVHLLCRPAVKIVHQFSKVCVFLL